MHALIAFNSNYKPAHEPAVKTIDWHEVINDKNPQNQPHQP